MGFLKNIRNYPLRNSIFMTNFLTSMVSTVLLGIFIYYLSNYLYLNSLKDEMSIVSQDTSQRIEQYFSSLNSTSHTVFYNTIFTDMLEETEKDPWDSSNRISRYLNSSNSFSNQCLGLGFYTLDGTYYASTENSMHVSQAAIEESVDPALFQKGKLCYLDMVVKSVQGYYAGVAVRKVRAGANTASDLKEIGVGVMYLNLNELLNTITAGSAATKSAIMVYDQNGHLIIQQHAGKELIACGKTLAKGDSQVNLTAGQVEYMAFCEEVPNFDWRIVVARSKQDVGDMLKFLRTGLFLFCALNMLLMLVLMYKINTRMTMPIQKLAEGMEQTAKSRMKVRVELPYKNEITFLAERFNAMNAELRELTQKIISTQGKLYETELAKGNLELLGLQTQINSHFLFNTLYYIRSRALVGDKVQVNQMIENLCGFLRYAVEAKQFVELKQEAENARLYLKILSDRWDGRVSCRVEIEPGFQKVEVLRMLLQPLVENSVLHGYDKMVQTRIVIKISCCKAGQCLLISVMDTGRGMPKRQADEMNAELEKPVDFNVMENMERSKNHGIGIKNINRRIKIYYGNAYGLSVKSFEGIGTIFKIRIPLDEE